jgi:hypothetical protein
MLYSIITTIQPPTHSVLALVEKLNQVGGKLIVAGDKKGPASYEAPSGEWRVTGGESNHSKSNIQNSSSPNPWPVEFLSFEDQLAMPFELANLLPVGHYARKNLAYIAAIQQGATCIYETDDDNAPNESWVVRKEEVEDCRLVSSAENRWVNVYRYFSEENVWPRGLPLDEIRQAVPETSKTNSQRRAPIQQGLVNGSADVDAIWRLVMDHEFFFEPGASVYLEPGNWCPFNTQTTWWWPVAYSLLYIPSYCSFRMCDIWKSFVAQRCLWELDMGIVFHPPEVYQDRNEHDLMRDFRDEISGYDKNKEIVNILESTNLKKGRENLAINLACCYAALVDEGIFPIKEMELVNAWVEAIHFLKHDSCDY